jgi:DNA-binding NtrC family response regulator
LEQLVAQGRFREDLYQRLNVFSLRVPPLRERPDDIAPQARYFLEQCQPGGLRVTDFGPRVLEALRLLPWPGNSRQLENVIREALAHKEGAGLLQMEDLPRWVVETLSQTPPPANEPTRPTPEPADAGKLTLNEAVEEFERRLLEATLRHHAGNRTRTAASLGLTRRSIFNKIKKYGLG